VGGGAGGDVTFAVDEAAERFLEEFVALHAPRMAFYSEDRGLVAPGNAVDVLVVDPIDGTRPTMAGLESACVAVAMTRIVTGQFNAVIEVGSRMIDEMPGLRAEFERIGRGQVLNNSPYDLAAPWLICPRPVAWPRTVGVRRLPGGGCSVPGTSTRCPRSAPRMPRCMHSSCGRWMPAWRGCGRGSVDGSFARVVCGAGDRRVMRCLRALTAIVPPSPLHGI
jgi:Inositol monophosphatase family